MADANLDQAVRLHVFRHAANTGQVSQALAIADALGQPQTAVEAAIQRLAAERVWILAPGTTTIWAANPFCAVPSGFRVEGQGRTSWGICIWDALGIPAALGTDATITTRCGECDDELVLEVKGGALAREEGVIHFAVPARRWWENIGFT